jgi:hypothetical protein
LKQLIKLQLLAHAEQTTLIASGSACKRVSLLGFACQVVVLLRWAFASVL